MPKLLSFVVDVSGSMAVFNGDGRLDRLMATMATRYGRWWWIPGTRWGPQDGWKMVENGGKPQENPRKMVVEWDFMGFTIW